MKKKSNINIRDFSCKQRSRVLSIYNRGYKKVENINSGRRNSKITELVALIKLKDIYREIVVYDMEKRKSIDI
jgi:hypothetical protein